VELHGPYLPVLVFARSRGRLAPNSTFSRWISFFGLVAPHLTFPCTVEGSGQERPAVGGPCAAVAEFPVPGLLVQYSSTVSCSGQWRGVTASMHIELCHFAGAGRPMLEGIATAAGAVSASNGSTEVQPCRLQIEAGGGNGNLPPHPAQ